MRERWEQEVNGTNIRLRDELLTLGSVGIRKFSQAIKRYVNTTGCFLRLFLSRCISCCRLLGKAESRDWEENVEVSGHFFDQDSDVHATEPLPKKSERE